MFDGLSLFGGCENMPAIWEATAGSQGTVSRFGGIVPSQGLTPMVCLFDATYKKDRPAK
jgi:hypothetical protein